MMVKTKMIEIRLKTEAKINDMIDAMIKAENMFYGGVNTRAVRRTITTGVWMLLPWNGFSYCSTSYPS